MSKTEPLLPFRIELKSGQPISAQVVYAVQKAIISGLLPCGQRFPSIRAISEDLRIHPNTTQKAVSVLVDDGFLEVQPGIGTTVARVLPTSARSTDVIGKEAERLILQAKRMRLELRDVQRIMENQWNKLTNNEREPHS